MHELPSIGSELVTPGSRCGIISVCTVRGLQVNQMNGLRMYTNGESTEVRGGCPVFYSRREDGPYYRWSYNEKVSAWQVGRVLRSGVSSKVLAPATWKTIPTRLQRSVIEHYEE